MNVIQVARNKKGLTQEQLAKKLGVDTQFVSNIERGLAPIPGKHFLTLNKEIQVPLQTLIDYNVERYVVRLKRSIKRK